ncbi:MAG: DNA pilot protein [Microviridae sp.]|nr:MAG: DNA pilot protein [Microviridae sp.]
MWEAIAAIVAAGVSWYNQKRANDKNQEEAEKQRQFAASQTATSYQRGVLDMQAAGLNPMLAYSQGGAQSAGSSQAVMQPEISAQGIQSSAQGVIGMLTGLQQIRNGEVSAANTTAMTDKIKSETMEKNLNTAKLAADIDATKATEGNLKAQAANTSEAVLGTRYESSAKQMAYRANMGENDSRLKGSGFEADVRRRKAEASLSEMDIPRAKNEAKWENDMGTLNPGLKSLMMILRGVSSARSSMR